MSSKGFWRARTEALTHLRRKRPTQIETLEEVFSLIDRCIDAYESRAASDQYARVCGLTLLKAKNLGHGIYSLTLDGLAQEAGALIRPFVEYTELLTYFKQFPEKVARALDGDLPSAGERAKAIDSIYKPFRQHLNQHASHSSYSSYSLAHIVDPQTRQFKKLQRMVPHVLETNARDLAAQLFLLASAAVLGLENLAPQEARRLAAEADAARQQLLRAFDLNSAL